MSRARWIAFVAIAGGCGPANRAAYSPGPATGIAGDVDVAVDVDVNFAAMNEVPVGGGELRLVAPRPAADRSATMAIAFPLRHTDVRAKVAGMSAMYTVTQTFENPYDDAIDAVYVFPLGAEAAITDYAIVIGERTVAGEIKKKEDARAAYEEAKSAGHTAALLEQEKRNIFRQRIANIAPHETIQVKVQYTELLGYADGQYEIAFPLVVGPRYLPATALGASPVASHHAGQHGRMDATSIPYADASVAGSTVSFTADIEAPVPVGDVTSPSHHLQVETASATRRHVTLANAGELPNRDLVVRYKAASDQTLVGLLAHRTDKTGYFTLVVQPKLTYKTGDITPREVMVVIDTSGSMSGQPLALAQGLAGALIDSLRPGDTFNVMAFSGGTNAMSATPIAGDDAGKQHGKAFVASLQSGGGTEMGPAMVKALETSPGADRVRLVYFLTDGFVGNDDMIVSAARHNLGANRIFSVGIGSAPNRALLEQIATVGRGFATYLNLGESAADVGEDLVRRTAFPYLTDLHVEWNGLAVGAVTPEAIPDVYAGQPLVVSGVYTQPGRGKVTVTGTVAGRRVLIPVEVSLPERVDDAPVAALWARKRVDELEDRAGDTVTPAVASQITELGLRFHMVTAYTSFVAVDRTRVVQPGGTSKIIEQPALVPAGVDANAAIGSTEESNRYAASSSAASSGGGYSGGGGGGGFGGGGDVDLLTLGLAVALIPLSTALRRLRRA
jgi:Ca-activated chloride channel family protein